MNVDSYNVVCQLLLDNVTDRRAKEHKNDIRRTSFFASRCIKDGLYLDESEDTTKNSRAVRQDYNEKFYPTFIHTFPQSFYELSCSNSSGRLECTHGLELLRTLQQQL